MAWLYRNGATVFLVAFTLGMIVAIELKRPYFFLKKDNLDQNLPYYVHNIRSLLSGEFPLFNFHQFLGTPVFSCIQSAALYLPNYLALCLSRLLFGNYYATMEIIAALHLLLASIGFFRLMRSFQLSQWSCAFGAFAWTFCGSVMTVGSEWIQVIGYAAYFPWILLFSLRRPGRFDYRSFGTITFLRVMALYLGSPPYFIYIVTFDILTLTAVYFIDTKKNMADEYTIKLKNNFAFTKILAEQACSYLCTAIIAAPLLLPALNQINLSASRNSPLSWQEYSKGGSLWLDWAGGLFMQFHNSQSKFSHIGLFTVFFCFAAFWQRDRNKKVVAVFLVLAVISLLWASNTFITHAIYHIPIFNRQRFPIKLIFFTDFFLIALATFGFDVLYRKLKTARSMTFFCIVAILFSSHIGNLYLFNTSSPQVPGKTVPYREPLSGTLGTGRIVTVIDSPTMDNDDKQMYLLGFNYATLFDLYHFAGYETLVLDKNQKASLDLNSSADMYLDRDTSFNPSLENLQYFRNWGVKWYVLDKAVRVNSSGILDLVYRDDKRSILYDSNAKPFVSWLDNVDRGGVNSSFTTNSIRITTAREELGVLLINVLYNPFFSATIDGMNVKITESKNQQMLLEVPRGKHAINVSYSDPYFEAGIFIMLSFFILIAAYLTGCRVKSRRIISDPHDQ